MVIEMDSENKIKEKISAKEKVTELVDKQFHRIFNPSHLFYTIVFIIVAAIIALFSFFPGDLSGDIALFLAATFSLMFIILMFVGVVPRLEKYMFSEEKLLDKYKILSVLGALGVSILIMGLYFSLGYSGDILIEFMGWDKLLPAAFIIVYFGWNLIQIFFIKTTFENISVKANNKIMKDPEKFKQNKMLATGFLIIGILIPILLQFTTFLGFYPYFEPQNVDDPNLIWFNAWNIAMYIFIGITSWRLISLFIISNQNQTPNVFSSIFYIFIWLYIWYRSFSFIYAFQSATRSPGIDIFRIIMDTGLMIMTAILVLRSLGNKVYRFKLFNLNNVSLFLFAFTIIYLEGQVVLITGAGTLPPVYTSDDQVGMLNNFMILIITFIFYWWYSEYTLERKGLIFKKNFKQPEVIEILNEYKEYLESSELIENGWESNKKYEEFLALKKLKIKGLKSKEQPPDSSSIDIMEIPEDSD